ncbi:hypothetical protein AUH73_08910 [archaeon 13_1_40CM_4_53_4]|nr:MAG: hypothetical protein AUI07_05175 [archaeon 13_2_20CM_2_53_6]OLC60733.1 MAG: hypothetical protein AUH73_08910 [archaeon 13_1_40CM_4_53_4]OLE58740.1 MAG: hypothetical protein AUG17_06025 [Crenarchaeota archaeon 13_1_20CM_2_53_14]
MIGLQSNHEMADFPLEASQKPVLRKRKLGPDHAKTIDRMKNRVMFSSVGRTRQWWIIRCGMLPVNVLRL